MDSRHIAPAAPEVSSAASPGVAPTRFRHKALAGLLAALTGWAGGHWFYLGRRHGWVILALSLFLVGTALRADPWYLHPAFFLFMIPVMAGFIEALVLCLMPDAKFDARYNAGLARTSRTGWAPVLVAIATLAGGTTALMTSIALLVQAVYGNLGG